MKENGLFVVATPIGNLEDISSRALRILEHADLVAAEDTRRTLGLMQHYGIGAKLQALHEHNEQAVVPRLLDRLRGGEMIALVSDAGTPLISDPGYRLVSASREAGLPVSVVPGPSAVTAALSVSGLPTDRFVFEGFLPAKSAARRKALQGLNYEARTIVLFESSHRILDCLSDLAEVMGPGRRVSLCRELTKQFETVLTGEAAAVLEMVRNDENQRKGEFVLIIEGGEAPDGEVVDSLELARALMEFLPASQAARVAARVTGARRKEIYQAISE